VSRDVLNKRQSRFQRSARPTGMILQERDKRILCACFECRYLTRSQVQQLFDIECVTRINLRLRKLWDHRFLDRRFLPTLSGSAEAVYLLGSHGVAIAAEKLGLDADEVLRHRALNLSINDSMLPHDLAVNDFRISVARQIGSDHRFQMKRWWDPRDCEQSFEILSEEKRIRTTLKPDGLLQLVFEDRLYSFFVELDQSTSGLSKLNDKYAAYAQFRALGLAEQAFKIQKFHLLIVAKSADRCANLKTLAEQSDLDFIWLANQNELKTDPLTSSVWYRTGQAAVRSLFDKPKVRVVA